jgi:hypothetical protein
MTRASVWISLGCCVGLFGCKPNIPIVRGDVIVDDVPLGLVDVDFLPAAPIHAALAEKASVNLGQLPSALFSVKSEADGTFFLKVTPGAYAVFARGRRISATGEVPYAWLFWKTVKADDEEQPRMRLSNDNLLFSRCNDCIPIEVKLPEPPPPPPPAAPFGSVPSEMQVLGSLDRELVQKVITKNRGQTRYCYESQLVQHPNLRCKVAVKFVIAPSGAVSTAAVVGSTAGNPQLEACLVGRVKTWVFPMPRGGGIVIVTYPFDFTR